MKKRKGKKKETTNVAKPEMINGNHAEAVVVFDFDQCLMTSEYCPHD
jgi:hypothetical protein